MTTIDGLEAREQYGKKLRRDGWVDGFGIGFVIGIATSILIMIYLNLFP
jgi:hypothetical protein